MQTPLVRVAPPREDISNHFSGRLHVASDSGERSNGNHHHTPEELLADRRVYLAIEHMVRHLNEPVRISTLAAVAGLSPSHLFSLFKLATGFTPLAFFIGLRVQRACELLADPQSSIKEAAELVGYSDRYYFSRVFKQVMGVPPGAYRRAALNSSASTRERASSNVATETSGRPNPGIALPTMKNPGIVTVPA
ncbi:MAG TPA: AraC family transcriptional regulator [Verrucomicrobiae bacterium]|nr:AraC family transcriptional regulator [Verrucomicrobiae bacterium]